MLLRWINAAVWALVSAGAFGRARAEHGCRRWWFAVGALAIGFAAETGQPVRVTLTNFLRQTVLAVGGPEAIRERRVAQVFVIACLVLPLSVYLAVRIVRNRELRWPVRLALLGIGVGLTGFVLEVISLHHIDQTRIVYPGFRAAALALAVVGVGCAWKWPRTASG